MTVYATLKQVGDGNLQFVDFGDHDYHKKGAVPTAGTFFEWKGTLKGIVQIINPSLRVGFIEVRCETLSSGSIRCGVGDLRGNDESEVLPGMGSVIAIPPRSILLFKPSSRLEPATPRADKTVSLRNTSDEDLSISAGLLGPDGYEPLVDRRVIVPPNGDIEIPLVAGRIELEIAKIYGGKAGTKIEKPQDYPLDAGIPVGAVGRAASASVGGKCTLPEPPATQPVRAGLEPPPDTIKLPSAFQPGETALLRGIVKGVHFEEGKVYYALTINPHADIELHVPSECLSEK